MIKIGDRVVFKKILNGKVCGQENDIYIIVSLNYKDWELCNVLVKNSRGCIYTTIDSIVKVNDDLPIYEQLLLFEV